MELVGWGGREGGRSTRPNASTATCHPLVHTYVHGGLSGPLNRCQPGAPRQETCCSLWVGGGVSIAICGKMPPPHWHRVHVDRRCFTLAAPGGLGRRPSDSPLGVLSSSCTDSSPKTKVFHVVFAAEKKQLLKDKDGEQEAAIKKRKSLFFCLPKR